MSADRLPAAHVVVVHAHRPSVECTQRCYFSESLADVFRPPQPPTMADHLEDIFLLPPAPV